MSQDGLRTEWLAGRTIVCVRLVRRAALWGRSGTLWKWKAIVPQAGKEVIRFRLGLGWEDEGNEIRLKNWYGRQRLLRLLDSRKCCKAGCAKVVGGYVAKEVRHRVEDLMTVLPVANMCREDRRRAHIT